MLISHAPVVSYPTSMMSQACISGPVVSLGSPGFSVISTSAGSPVNCEPSLLVDRNSPDYLAQLLNDKKLLQLFPNVFTHMDKILDEEINRVRGNLFHLSTNKEPLVLPDESGSVVSLSEKLVVPVRDFPDFNFVGRILGPRGMTAKLLEQDTGCKIMVRGKGSMRDKAKEEQNRGKANWEHLNEDLHVLISVEDTPKRAEMKLKRAVDEVKKLLVPAPEGEDELKKLQLMELAIMNGTYREGALAGLPGIPVLAHNHPSAQTTQGARMLTPQLALPQGLLRAPMAAGAPIILASGPRLQIQAQYSASVAASTNGMAGLCTGANQGSTLVSGAGGFVYPFDPYMQSLLEYGTPAFEGSAAGSMPKVRRTVMAREHPYTRSPLI